MLDRLERILKFSGEGHSANIQTEIDERIQKLGIRANVSRIVSQHGAYRSEQRRMDELSWLYGHAGLRHRVGRGTSAARTSTGNSSLYTRVAVPFRDTTVGEEPSAYLKKYGRGLILISPACETGEGRPPGSSMGGKEKERA